MRGKKKRKSVIWEEGEEIKREGIEEDIKDEIVEEDEERKMDEIDEKMIKKIGKIVDEGDIGGKKRIGGIFDKI